AERGEGGCAERGGGGVRGGPKADAGVTERLGVALVRGPIDESPLHAVEGTSAAWLRVVAPSGKIGYIPAGTIGALVSDQICYSKDASGWKITDPVARGDRQ